MVQEFLAGDLAAAGCDVRAEVPDVDVGVAQPHSHDRDVSVELLFKEDLRDAVERLAEIHEWPGDIKALRKSDAERLASHDLYLPPD